MKNKRNYKGDLYHRTVMDQMIKRGQVLKASGSMNESELLLLELFEWSQSKINQLELRCNCEHRK